MKYQMTELDEVFNECENEDKNVVKKIKKVEKDERDKGRMGLQESREVVALKKKRPEIWQKLKDGYWSYPKNRAIFWV